VPVPVSVPVGKSASVGEVVNVQGAPATAKSGKIACRVTRSNLYADFGRYTNRSATPKQGLSSLALTLALTLALLP